MSDNKGESKANNHVTVYGKVAKFPKNVKTNKAYSFLENVKIPKGKIWYILVEKQDNELQMVKYNRVEGVNLQLFVSDLKTYYLRKYHTNQEITEALKKLEVVGEERFSIIKNISKIKIDGKELIAKIAEDLIHLLAV